MNTTELLSRFCGKNDIREYLNVPMRRDGFLYATNGHIAVRVVDEPGVVAFDGNTAILKVADGIEKMLAATYQPNGHVLAETDAAQVLAGALPCGNCQGTGVTPACGRCGNTGVITSGWRYGNEIEIDCPACGGIPDAPGTPCCGCEGDGKYVWDLRIPLGHADYNPRYIALLAELPGATLYNSEPTEDPYHYGAGRVHFDGGLALVMPMRQPRGEVAA